jgi:hypothetical protein
MAYLNSLFGAVVGGAVGGFVWALIAFYGNVEIGWIAWGIGVLCGFCVKLVAKNQADSLTGVIAAFGSVTGIGLGKYLTVAWLIGKMTAGVFDDARMTQVIELRAAVQTAEEMIEARQKVDFTNGKSIESADSINDFPASVQQAARQKIKDLPPGEYDKMLKDLRQEMEDMKGMLAPDPIEAIKASLHPLDTLFAFLAVMSAYQIASKPE